jgi:hypothetical protein
MEDIPSMDHEIRIPSRSRLEGLLVIGEEIVAAPPPLHAGVKRQVEAQVSVGQE